MFVFEEESIFCESCYEKKFAKTCHSCHRAIVGVSPYRFYGNDTVCSSVVYIFSRTGCRGYGNTLCMELMVSML